MEDKNKKVYEFSGSTLDNLWNQVRAVCGETKRDIYDDGYLEDIRDDADIIIRYDNEYSLWVAIVIVDTIWD